MLWRGGKRWAAAVVLVAALAVSAAPARAAGLERAGELGEVWEELWQWVSGLLAPIVAAAGSSDQGSHIDPNG